MENTTQLTPTTKELIFERIKQLELGIDLKERSILNATIDTDHLLEFWHIEKDLLEAQIEHFKTLLFNN